MLTPDCQNRLQNWKFEDAVKYLTADATAEEDELVTSLAALLGNAEWFLGNLGSVVDAVVRSLVSGPPATEQME